MQDSNDVKVIHPFILAAYPIIFLYANNMSYHITLTEVAALAAASVAVTLAVYAIASRALRNAHKAGLVVAMGLLYFYSYGHFYELVLVQVGSLVKYLPNMGHTLLLTSYTILFAFVCFLLISLIAGSGFIAVTRFMNHLSCILVALSLIGIAAYILGNAPVTDETGVDCMKIASEAGKNDSYPDIYYVILDAYARTDVMNERYGFDNREFLGYLKGRGFYVPAESRCNYCYTFLSLASSLNMEYINYLSKTVGEDSSDRWEIGRMTRNNKALCFLKSRGYRYVTFTNYFEADYRQEADLKVECSLTDFTRIVFTTTVLRALDVKEKRDDELCILRELPEVRHKVEGPRFVFAHLQAPHPPYVLDDNYMGGKGMPYDASEKERYVENIDILNGRLEEIIDRITSEPGRPAVIILQSDQAPYSRPTSPT